MLKQFSNDLAALVAAASPRLVHIGGRGISGRTGLIWSESLIVSLARQAKDGEAVEVLLSTGSSVTATVKAYDARTGLVLLSASGLPFSAWKSATLPSVGSLAVTVAFASPGGVEARLDLVRYVGGATEWGRGAPLQHHLQTDGQAFPGFSGAAVLDPEGGLIGFVAENSPGNGGYIVPVADLELHIKSLSDKGTRRKPYLGVNTRPSGTDQGLAVTEVEAGSPAEKGGLVAGDLMLSVAGETVSHPMQLAHVLSKSEAGASVEVKVLRAAAVHSLNVTLGGR